MSTLTSGSQLHALDVYRTEWRSLATPRRKALQWGVAACSDMVAFAVCAIPGAQWQRPDYLWTAFAWLLWVGVINSDYQRDMQPLNGPLSRLPLLLMQIAVIAFLQAGMNRLVSAPISVHEWQKLWLSVMVVLPITRFASRKAMQWTGLWSRPTVIIGTGSNARYAREALQTQATFGADVLAFIEPQNLAPDSRAIDGLPCFSLGYTPHELQSLSLFHCVVALEAEQADLLKVVMRTLMQAKVADVHVVPAMRGVPLEGIQTSHFLSHETLFIHLSNRLASPWSRFCKRAFDVIASAFLLVLLSPVLAIVAIGVAQDGGAVFFGHPRIGRNGQTFQCLKFRSMVVNAQDVLKQLLEKCPIARAEWERDFKLKDDPRVSKLGSFIRRSSLDELPQLWNVLKGDMSLVGPRPIVAEELERYGDEASYYLQTRPGISGLWQVSGRNDVDYARRVYLDAWYVKNWTLWNDVVILFKTVLVVFKRAGAY